MLVGMSMLFTSNLPDLLIGSELKQIALRAEDGFALARGRPSSMIASLWANGLGYHDLPEAGAPAWRCDRLGCIAHIKGQVIAFPQDAAALAEDCEQATLIISKFNDVQCARSIPMIGPEELENSNVMAFWFTPNGIRRETSTEWQGNRIWSAIPAAED